MVLGICWRMLRAVGAAASRVCGYHRGLLGAATIGLSCVALSACGLHNSPGQGTATNFLKAVAGGHYNQAYAMADKSEWPTLRDFLNDNPTDSAGYPGSSNPFSYCSTSKPGYSIHAQFSISGLSARSNISVSNISSMPQDPNNGSNYNNANASVRYSYTCESGGPIHAKAVALTNSGSGWVVEGVS